MRLNGYVIPNIVGVDIGCGMLSYNMGPRVIDLKLFDEFIRKTIPSGFNINTELPDEDYLTPEFQVRLSGVCSRTSQSVERVLLSLGTLGGGNHFIEIDKAPNDDIWFTIHSGSRNFGLKIAEWHQNKARSLAKTMFMDEGKYKDLEYLPMEFGGKEYCFDMQTAQEYACENRELIAQRILKGFFGVGTMAKDRIETIHNYISFKDNIIRKGAVSAQLDERLIIPFNMRDGIAICKGKGNVKYNFSAPHGAGRILSRQKAKHTLSVEDFKKSMEGIYSSCINEGTLDESPMAYKDMNVILENIKDTVDIEYLLKPIFNFKAEEDEKPWQKKK
jgi:RNA-splicing ligase RtcB